MQCPSETLHGHDDHHPLRRTVTQQHRQPVEGNSTVVGIPPGAHRVKVIKQHQVWSSPDQTSRLNVVTGSTQGVPGCFHVGRHELGAHGRGCLCCETEEKARLS